MAAVIVALDGSETSREAFRVATEEAQWRDAELLAVHVMAFPATLGYGIGYIDFENLRASGESFLDAEVDKLMNEFDDGFPVAVHKELAIGHTGVELTRIAHNDGGEPAALVVAGSRGLGGFKGLLLGSVTTYLVHHLACPVLVIPSEDALADA